MNVACHQKIIEMDSISFSYNKKKVIDQLSFSVMERDFVGLIGSNGAGKTTLLKMLTGLIKPDEGQFRLFGVPIERFKDWERIGYVPQKNALNPLFPATVKEVVLSGLYHRKKIFSRLSKFDQQRSKDAMDALGILELSQQKIGRLSGGQQQRVFLARALVHNPELLILDEPMIGIDAETQESFFHMIRHMHQKHNIAFLMVSHDMEMMLSYLGDQPLHECGKLKFYVKHCHALEDCEHEDLSHTIKDLKLYSAEMKKDGVEV